MCNKVTQHYMLHSVVNNVSVEVTLDDVIHLCEHNTAILPRYMPYTIGKECLKTFIILICCRYNFIWACAIIVGIFRQLSVFVSPFVISIFQYSSR